ncbi:MAG: binding-protein-dependent transport system inner rane component [Herbinix sp.]|jgi:NitT/TauT family transport system permease protein/taurine transport system permease protein|nr:binding-protein-dependent transport system inner rane component [Herbinix sp.]
MKKKENYWYLSILSILAFIFIWWLFCDVLKMTKESTLPGPIKVMETFIKKLSSTAPDGATLIEHIGSSLKISMGGWAMGVVIGTPLGICMAWYKKIDLFVRPVFDLIRPVPGLAWIPLMIILFGIGLTSKIVTVFLSAFVPCVLNSYTGIRQTKDVHLWVGQTFGASNFQMLINIAVPTALPLVMTGVRVALGASWTCIVAAEMLASTKGLGYMIQQARGIFRPDIIICGMIAIGVIGALFSWLLSLIENRIVRGAKHI